RVIDSDGKTENAQHTIALDPFTLAVLKAHTGMLDDECREFGPDYQDHGLLFCWKQGKPPHPDTITRRFHRLAEAAGLPKISLHDVRHSYATAGPGRQDRLESSQRAHRPLRRGVHHALRVGGGIASADFELEAANPEFAKLGNLLIDLEVAVVAADGH